MRKKIIILVSVLILTVPILVAAQYGLEETGKAAGLSSQMMQTSVEEYAGNIIKVVLSVIGILFLGLMFYGGLRWMTAHGEAKHVEKAKDIIEAAVIGIVLVMAAYAITYFVVKSLIT